MCLWNVFKYCTNLQHWGNTRGSMQLSNGWINLRWTDPAPSVWVSGAGRLAHRRTYGRICGSCAPLCSAHRFETSPADSEICTLHTPCSWGEIIRANLKYRTMRPSSVLTPLADNLTFKIRTFDNVSHSWSEYNYSSQYVVILYMVSKILYQFLIYLIVKMNLYELSESTTVVISDRLGITKRF